MAGDSAVPPGIVERVHNALNPPKAETPPATQAQTPPATPAEGEKARNDKGQFVPKQDPSNTPGKPELTPEARGLLAGLKAERERRKEAEGKVSAYEKRLADLEARLNTPAKMDRKELLKDVPEDTQNFWANKADPIVRDTAREEALALLGPDAKEALDYVRSIKAKEKETQTFRSDLAEFIEDAALEGHSIDPVALVNSINRFRDEYGIELGRTNRQKFENAVGLLGGLPKPDRSVADAAAEQKAKEEADAAAKARAGGVAPGSAATVPPPNERAALQKGVRELAGKGDLRSIADIIAKRVPKHPLLSR